MWVINVILICTAIAVVGWLLWNYGGELTNAFGVLFSGSQSVLLAFIALFIGAFKGAVVAALAGGGIYLIFKLAGAPEPITNRVGIIIAAIVFALFMLKTLWDNFNNLRWRMRHEIRNRYGRKR
jgi:hypothetical protein